MTAELACEQFEARATTAGSEHPETRKHMSETLPRGWQRVRLTEVAQLESGHTPSRTQPRYWDGEIPWISLHDTDALDGNEIFVTKRTVTQEGISNSSARLLPKGTVVFSRTATVGKATTMGREMATSQDFANYVCGPKVHNHFLVHLFRFMAPHWKRVMAGSIHNTVYMPVFEKLEVTLPPRSEQEAIAAVLQDFDVLLAKLDALIAKKRDLKQAAMQQLLTGNTRLPGCSALWEHKTLGQIGRCLRGVSYKADSDLAPYDMSHTRRLLRSNNVQNSTVVTNDVQFVNVRCVSDDQVLRSKDVLICMANGSKALVGKAGLFDVEDGHAYTFGAFMGCFRVHGAYPEFVGYLFQTNRYRNCISNLLAGSSINNLRPSNIECLEFPFPSTDEQIAIATVLSDMDAEIATLESRRDKTRTLKQGMMQELLTGRIRLI